ncbi:MAG: hypothetical protein M3Q38_04345 [Chloroflexota bacterium]|nr:hypothetical protein [Chloroflexota bacterium]
MGRCLGPQPGGGQSYSIGGVGGPGNDVVLTAVAPVPTVGGFGRIALFLMLATVALWRLRRSPADGVQI